MGRDVDVTWRPLTQWPAGRVRTGGLEDAKFTRLQTIAVEGGGQNTRRERVSFQETRRELAREIGMLGVGEVIVQVDIPPRAGKITLDDLVNMKTSAVVVTFQRNGQPVTVATDYFRRWQDNLRAIVKGLEALRLLERYHIANTGAQYTAWTAIPASTTITISTEQAAEIVAKRAGGSFSPADIVAHSGIAKEQLRRARANTHPDRNNGDDREFKIVESARRVLEAHHGASL